MTSRVYCGGGTCNGELVDAYAGSAGNDANCYAVMRELGQGQNGPVLDYDASDFGCQIEYAGTVPKIVRGTGGVATCGGAAIGVLRACRANSQLRSLTRLPARSLRPTARSGT